MSEKLVEIEKAREDSHDIEKLLQPHIDAVILSSAHAVNEQLMFVFDAKDESLNIFIFLRPFKSFWTRLRWGLGYIFNLWCPFYGDWESFDFNKDEAERLIGFLKKIE
jgi:hypothetical protein